MVSRPIEPPNLKGRADALTTPLARRLERKTPVWLGTTSFAVLVFLLFLVPYSPFGVAYLSGAMVAFVPTIIFGALAYKSFRRAVLNSGSRIPSYIMGLIAILPALGMMYFIYLAVLEFMIPTPLAW